MFIFSWRHYTMTLLIAIIAGIMIAMPHPLWAFSPTFGGKIRSRNPVQPPCNEVFKLSKGQICLGGGVLNGACSPGGYIMGFGSGTIQTAWCKP